jgi:hypothetical protein
LKFLVKRRRPVYAALISAVIAIGLLSRRYPNLLPDALGKYPGDTLWALTVFLGIGFLFSNIPTVFAGATAFGFSCAIEFSQLYQAPWIDSIRTTVCGRLILGRGFSWNDIIAYACGIAIGSILEIGLCGIFCGKRALR